MFYEGGFFSLFADFGVALAESVEVLLFGSLGNEGIDVYGSTMRLAISTVETLDDLLLCARVKGHHGEGAMEQDILLLDLFTLFRRSCNLH